MTKRSRGRPPGRTAQGEATRELLYETAITLFSERGYEGTTLRAIAKAADVSPGLLYRYFPSKQAVVMELYRRLSTRFAERCADLPSGSWFARFTATLRASLGTLEPHRTTLKAVLPLMIADTEGGLLSEAGAPARDRVRQCFLDAVDGASNAPGPDLNGPLGRLLDLAQLGAILFWLLDRSPDQRATAGLLAWIGGLEMFATAALWAPGTSRTLRTLDALASDALYD